MPKQRLTAPPSSPPDLPVGQISRIEGNPHAPPSVVAGVDEIHRAGRGPSCPVGTLRGRRFVFLAHAPWTLTALPARHWSNRLSRGRNAAGWCYWPIGAYEPRWFMAYQHMDPPQAYRAFRDLGARHMVGMHWGAFDLTDEPVDLAPRKLARVLAARGGDPRVRAMAVGERWPVPPIPV